MANFEGFCWKKKLSSNLFFLKNGYFLGALCKFEEPLKFVESSLKMSSMIRLFVYIIISICTTIPSMAHAEFNATFGPLASSFSEFEEPLKFVESSLKMSSVI